MEKLAGFIVRRRWPIFIIALILTAVSVIGIMQVNINSDLTRYLPEDSSVRIGMDIMTDEFDELAPLEVMYKDLSPDEIEQVAEELTALEHVDSVLYEVGEEGTDAEGYVLFSVNLIGGIYSDSAAEGLQEIYDYTDGLDVAIAGEVVDNANLSASLVVTFSIAAVILLIILFIMCSSWLEPILFLIVIGIAIILNMGTNVVMDSVSNMTFSIAAVLQLALSMDYSIMLTNRYRQERAQESDRVVAMVKALRGGFSAIVSSSITTIAGLLCLIFMSFTIGLDMGLVLAKGVAFSILCVLFVLPGLMVSCDAAIQKSHKPAPKITLRWFGRLSYSGRYVIAIIFVLLIVTGFAIKGSSNISYFMESSNEDEATIAEVFEPTEQIVVVYDKDADGMSDVIATIEGLDGIKSIQSYESTLGAQLTADELAASLGMDPTTIQMIYYAYFNGTEPTATMSIADFAAFLQNDVATNESFAAMLDADMLEQIGTLTMLGNAEELEAPRTSDDMAAVLGVDTSQIDLLYFYYFMQSGSLDTGTITIPEFVSFVNESVLTDPIFSSMFDEDTQAQFAQLAALTNVENITTPYSADQLAEVLGMDESLIETVLQYQVMATASLDEYLLTIPQVLATLIDDVTANDVYAAYFDEETLAQLSMLRSIADLSATGAELTSQEMADLLGIDSSYIDLLYQFAPMLGVGESAYETMTIPAFLAMLIDNVANNAAVNLIIGSDLAAQLQDQVEDLTLVRTIADAAANGYVYDLYSMADMFGMDSTLMSEIYLMNAIDNGIYTLPQMSVQAFLAYVSDMLNENEEMRSMLGDESVIAELYQARAIVDNVVEGTAYDAFSLAELFGIDPTEISELLMYRTYLAQDPADHVISLATLVPFISELLASDTFDVSGMLGQDSLEQLQIMDEIVSGTLEGRTYTYSEMYDLLGGFTESLDANSVQLLYLLDEAVYNSDPAWTMSLEDFVSYAANTIAQDPLFVEVIDADSAAQLIDAQVMIDEGKAQLVGDNYARAIIESTFGLESEEMGDLIVSLRSILDDAGVEYYIVGNAPMGYEMSESFTDEFNFITYLTAAVIFIIVLIAFRNVLIPLILVMLIWTAVNLTVGISTLQGDSVYYIALIIVQALLMGATIDYAILFTTYYRNSRKSVGIRESLFAALSGSCSTIFTSAGILVLITFVVGLTSADITTAEVCLMVARGALMAFLLVILLLPGTLAALDRFVGGRHRVARDVEAPADEGGGNGIGGAASMPDMVALADAAAEVMKAYDERTGNGVIAASPQTVNNDWQPTASEEVTFGSSVDVIPPANAAAKAATDAGTASSPKAAADLGAASNASVNNAPPASAKDADAEDDASDESEGSDDAVHGSHFASYTAHAEFSAETFGVDADYEHIWADAFAELEIPSPDEPETPPSDEPEDDARKK